ncbi:MAG: carbon-phosphorus lyase complex subunit PhnI [Sphaerobacteraceae bacterium]|nr:MAG: carbon-phosphorus lyase complex subunit PhnI [Sphaerobacteraceae bacterium]
MGYTSVRGGLDAIHHAEQLIERTVQRARSSIDPAQIQSFFGLALDRVMSEGSLYDPELAAIALQQAEGDIIEAVILMRSFRSTLPRVGYSFAARIDEQRVHRRVSAAYRDIPGGQVLGCTRDYTLRLLGMPVDPLDDIQDQDVPGASPAFPTVIDFLRREGLMAEPPPESPEENPADITREPLRIPAPRSARLQILARGESGAVLSLAYGALRGYGLAHPYVGEIRSGPVPVSISHPVTGRRARIGWLPVTEAHMVFPGSGSLSSDAADMSVGFGISTGRDERKAISMGIIDENLTRAEGKTPGSPIEDQEYVLHHIDSVEASGFVEHLKLPHYVTFQSQLHQSRRITELVKASRAND